MAEYEWLFVEELPGQDACLIAVPHAVLHHYDPLPNTSCQRRSASRGFQKFADPGGVPVCMRYLPGKHQSYESAALGRVQGNLEERDRLILCLWITGKS